VQTISAVTVVVPDYDLAIDFYVGRLGFLLVEDTPLGEGKRWVLVRPDGPGTASLLLAKAHGEAQQARIGDQTGGRVFLFLNTEDFDGDYARYLERGVSFLDAPREEAYGKVAVFADPFGNKWDLIQPRPVSRP
jgi:catechol 2,3-dioxygenase-like lactoylglutathione lyase family enzyme